MAIQIGKYKRPGIFIEEFDKSVISAPTFEGLNNMVIGVSKKGPVNTPILLKNISDLEAIFGQLDRNMERKGSYFHRTIAKMLESSPVYAINLLLTDDNLDIIEYQSLSATSNKNNDVEREGPYRRFFDTTGFWKRDTESFINLTKNNVGYSDRIFNLTNLSDKFLTTFVVKSKLTGFDRTLLEWYGSIDKMPPYVNTNDYASDYMVDVIVISGDWSNYQQLSVDPRWSSYFNTSGLIKGQIRNFANDRNVTALAYYEGLSLIPYFRDGNGRNIFIETTINRDTDRTGLFCSFNSDLLETDFPNGLVDLIGNGLVGSDQVDINFLSYKETIVESVSISNVILDRPGNVLALGATSRGADHSRNVGLLNTPSTDGIVKNGYRTGWYAEDFVFNVNLNSVASTTSSVVVRYDSSVLNTGVDAYAVIGGQDLTVVGSTFSVLGSSYPFTSVTASFTVAFVIDGTGNMVMVDNVFTSTNPVVNSSDVVLGYVDFNVTNQVIATSSVVYNPVSVGLTSSSLNGFIDMTATDYTITDLGSGSIKVEFLDTANTANSSNYEQFRKIKYFNRMLDALDGTSKNKMSIVINSTTMEKRSLDTMTVTNIVTTTTSNKSFVINTGLTSADLTDVIGGYLVLYINDNEFIMSPYKMETKNTTAFITGVTSSTSYGGVISKYSEFYDKYFTGAISSGDYFWSNLVISGPEENGYGSPDVIFVNGENVPSGTSSASGYDYVVFYNTEATFGASSNLANLSVNDVISIPSSSSNKGTFTIISGGGAVASTLAAQLGYTGGDYYAYKVNENTVDETVFSVSVIYDYLTKHYLRMYIDASNLLYVSFMDVLLASYEPINLNNQTIFIQSDISNYKQSIEIETNVTGYVQQPNKILINGSRYTEIKVGDFLEAYYDVDLLADGQVAKRLTRVLSKRSYAGDTTLTEVTCDARIATYNFNNDYQTFRYTTIEDYVSTYKAISIKGFRVRQDSLPDGTEAKQNQILNLMAKGTPLFKAIANKEALDFRYLIDSFGLGLTERSKQQLVDICGDRLDSFGFINMPSLKQFKNSTSPSFVNANGVLEVEFVSKGGDPESNPAFLYSFGDGAGTTCTGFFTPYVTVNDNGRPADVPPAMFAATTYMRKHTSNVSAITPWTIAAGVTNGKVTNIAGLEIDYTPSDIEWLNQAQMNPIVFKRNRGYIIETENTGQTLYKSALSYIHVREVLIELERELSRMLLDFQWKFNTPDIRAEIKLRADVICETYVSRSGLYNYFNKIDEENNTSEVIDNQIGVLDTYVEPIKGMGIIVNNVTILRTGAISSGGFING